MDGKLTKDEVTDPRLRRFFDQADTNKDGVVTKEELMALAAKIDAEYAQGGFGGKGPKGENVSLSLSFFPPNTPCAAPPLEQQ
jgi:hypothetical protein